MKTTKAITTMTITMTPMITGVEMAPDRPWLRNWASAAGISATIPTKMIREIPLPMPRAVICSPSHIRNIVPPTSVIRQASLNCMPGSWARPPASRLTAMPQPCRIARPTVP